MPIGTLRLDIIKLKKRGPIGLFFLSCRLWLQPAESSNKRYRRYWGGENIRQRTHKVYVF